MYSKKKKIRFLLLIATALAAFFWVPAGAQENNLRSTLSLDSGINNVHKTDQFGVGLQVGANSGITSEYWVSEINTLNFNLTGIGSNFGLGGSYNWMIRNGFGSSEVARTFVPFVGAGMLGVFGTNSDNFHREDQNFALAVQVPVGVEYLPSTQRFGIFAKLSPSVELTPYGHLFIDGDVGARFYF